MNELEINSWQQFVKIAEALDVGDPGTVAYAFRGHSIAEWALQPSLLRKLGQEISEERALEVERKALEEFQSQAHLHLSTNTLSSTTDVVSWWTLMQHHGAPTRLIDWTRSIFVAAYFAVTSEPTMAGAIWGVHARTLSQLMTEKYGDVEFPTFRNTIEQKFLQSGAAPVLTFVHRKARTARMISQQGLFSICDNVLGDQGAILIDIMPTKSDKPFILKLVIPASLKATFLRNLRGMNITANSLFPGLDGLGISIDEYVQVMRG